MRRFVANGVTLVLLLSLATCHARDLQGEAEAPRTELTGPSTYFYYDPNSASDITASSVISSQAVAVPQSFVDLVNKHNTYRANHGAPPLQWHEGLATAAADWARQCRWEHTPSRVVDGQQYGQNLYAGMGYTVSEVLSQSSVRWYEEVKDWNFATHSPMYPNDPTKQTGHFTQLVWVETTLIGCALNSCNNMVNIPTPGLWQYVVCNHLPAGNMMSWRTDRYEFYKVNVLPAGTIWGPPQASPSPSPVVKPSPSPTPVPSPSPSPLTNILSDGQFITNSTCLQSLNGQYRLCTTRFGDLTTLMRGAFSATYTTRWRSYYPVMKRATVMQYYKLAIERTQLVLYLSSVLRRSTGTRTTDTAVLKLDMMKPIQLLLKDNGRVALVDAATGQCMAGLGLSTVPPTC